MDWKKIGKALLFPPLALMLALLPIATACLVWALACLTPAAPAAIGAYLLSFYTLVVWSAQLPRLIRAIQAFKQENPYARRWLSDPQLRVKTSLYGGLIWNTAYALLQLGMGIWHGSLWFFSLAAYYLCLAVMRFFLARYTAKHTPGQHMRRELLRYRLCGWSFLVMNLALSVMVFFMVYWNRTFHHHFITTIAMAAYTFTAFTMAIINMIRYRKYNSPVYTASKLISLASACVSMLTLEATMLTTFGSQTLTPLARKLFLACTGGVICVFMILTAIYMIRQSNVKLEEHYGK